MSETFTCVKVGCDSVATYDRPLCYPHWQEFDRFEIFECEECHRFDGQNWVEENTAEVCWDYGTGKDVAPRPHGPIEYRTRYLYILKLDGGQFYIGQTNDLELRLREHQDSATKSTAGKHPKLVWFEERTGNRQELNGDEQRLTVLANKNPRAIRRLVTEWQRPFKLVDFCA